MVYRVDALLFPIGLLAAIAAADAPAASLLVLPLAYLLLSFSREREASMRKSLELGRAYRGTALLLRDLLEEDDEYTGRHTEDVVGLTVSVAERMGLDEDTRRSAELGALLHDIGKIAVPDEIINKPGPLNDEEWAIMKTHTVEGERMLAQVGGLLADVGLVVRASHERWDGGGYPDGLAGDAIPLAACIVSACDAFNAMTTDRSYRKALPLAVAVGELRKHSGTQFCPAVVDALVELVLEAEAAESRPSGPPRPEAAPVAPAALPRASLRRSRRAAGQAGERACRRGACAASTSIACCVRARRVPAPDARPHPPRIDCARQLPHPEPLTYAARYAPGRTPRPRSAPCGRRPRRCCRRGRARRPRSSARGTAAGGPARRCRSRRPPARPRGRRRPSRGRRPGTRCGSARAARPRARPRSSLPSGPMPIPISP